MNDKQDLSLVDFVKRNAFQIFGLLVVAGNVWIAYQLAPLVGRVSAIEVRAANIENRLNVDEQYIPRFVASEQKVSDMKEAIDRIESLLDRVYGPAALNK